MYNFKKNQKLILGIAIIIIVVLICYYVYAREENSENTIEIEKSLETQNEETQEEEHYSDEKILVHISGAVNKEGVVELKPDSRIADAIDKARRSKRRCIY